MSSVWFNVLVIVVLVVLGGFFVAAELAIVSLRESQVDRLALENGRRGALLADLARHPNRFLAACQVGVTLAGFISAAFGEAQIAPHVEPLLVERGINPALANVIVLVAVTSLIAYFALVVGELVPKRIALQKGERIALLTARPLHAVATFLRPVIALLSMSTDTVVRLLGMDPKAGRETISEEELISLVSMHEDLSQEERSLISDVFAAGDRELREVMLPRTEVSFLEAAMSIAEAVTVVAEQPHSRYPVIRDSSDDVVGFVHVRDLLSVPDRTKRVNSLVRAIASFPGTNEVLVTLAEMRRSRQHLAIVQDEYGGTAGIVTLEDLVEELIGDVTDEYDVVRIHESSSTPGEIVMDGLVNLEDFDEVAGFALPEGPYETVAGFVVALLGRVPLVGDVVKAAGHEFHVVELDGRRVSRVAVRTAATIDPTQ